MVEYIKGLKMKRTITIATTALLGLSVCLTSVSADVNKGQKIYLKKLKASCGMNGDKFAMKHTQKEWEDINGEGKFAEEVAKICPNSEIDPKFLPDLYDFSHHYAKDSGNIPSC